MEKNYHCPRCGAPLSTIGRGNGLRFFSCDSDTCSKEPFQFSLFFQASTKIPVVWDLACGNMHQLSISKSTEIEESR
jgi:hypothetical protein